VSAVAEPVGHDAIRAMLRGLAASSASADAPLHHAWLFAGPAGVGKYAVARWWASLLKCPAIGQCDPVCESCRLAAGAVHPDILETGPAPKDKDAHPEAGEDVERERYFKVEQSRELIRRLSLRPTRPGPRVAVVREAASMTAEAQNALLKLLEEPPGTAVIVLVTDNPGAMLQTVRSRCRHLVFGALAERDVAEALSRLGHDETSSRAAAACSRGSVARALVFDADGLADRERVLLAFEELRDDPSGLDAMVQALAARKDSGYALVDLLEWQMAKVEASLGRAASEPSDALAEILSRVAAKSGGADHDAACLLDEAQQIQWAIDAVARNANAKLVIRDLLLNVRVSAR
jgi:DNA polymerase-3 subunit delta'